MAPPIVSQVSHLRSIFFCSYGVLITWVESVLGDGWTQLCLQCPDFSSRSFPTTVLTDAFWSRDTKPHSVPQIRFTSFGIPNCTSDLKALPSSPLSTAGPWTSHFLFTHSCPLIWKSLPRGAIMASFYSGQSHTMAQGTLPSFQITFGICVWFGWCQGPSRHRQSLCSSPQLPGRPSVLLTAT